MILFCKNKTKTVLIWQDALRLPEICLAQSLGFYLCCMGYAKWAELGVRKEKLLKGTGRKV